MGVSTAQFQWFILCIVCFIPANCSIWSALRLSARRSNIMLWFLSQQTWRLDLLRVYVCVVCYRCVNLLLFNDLHFTLSVCGAVNCFWLYKKSKISKVLSSLHIFKPVSGPICIYSIFMCRLACGCMTEGLNTLPPYLYLTLCRKINNAW